MLLEAIAKLLEDAGLGVRGQSIFIGGMPESVDEGIRLAFAPGLAGFVDPDLPWIRRSDFQIVVRKSDFAAANGLINQAFGQSIINNQQLEGVYVYSARPFTQPFPLGREEGAHWHLACNVTVIWRET